MAPNRPAGTSGDIQLAPHQPKGMRVETRPEEYPCNRMHWDEVSVLASNHDCLIIGEDLFTCAAFAEFLQTMLDLRMDVGEVVDQMGRLELSRRPRVFGVPGQLRISPSASRESGHARVVLTAPWREGRSAVLTAAAARELARSFLHAYETRREQMPA